MSSKLKLTGTGGGDTIIQGNDSITTDQTFTFPDNGGEIVTAPVGGSVVGYQQGVWTPEWVQGITASGYTSTGGLWTRTGNLVFVAGRIQGTGGSTDGNVLRLGKLPYKQQTDPKGAGAITIGFPGSLVGAPAVPFWALTIQNEDFIQFYANSGSSITGNDISSVTNTLHFSGTYLTADTTWTPINGATVS